MKQQTNTRLFTGENKRTKMEIEQKINKIGRILADIQLEVYKIRVSQQELRDFIINPGKLDAKIKTNQILRKSDGSLE